jgi:hypothetical protein
MGVSIRLKKDSELLFSRYEAMKKMTGAVSEAQALRILNCSGSTLRRWSKRLGIRQFMGIYTPLYLKKDVEKIRIYRQFGTLIKKLKKL